MATLRELRLAAGLTQQEVAERLGVSVSQVSRWERPDGPRPQRGNRLRIAKLFKVPAESIDWETGTTGPKSGRSGGAHQPRAHRKA
jgi:transcriptional regulator with XRE-family HTH domain